MIQKSDHLLFLQQGYPYNIDSQFHKLQSSNTLSIESRLNDVGTVYLGKRFFFMDHVTHLSLQLSPYWIQLSGFRSIGKGLSSLRSLLSLSLSIGTNNLSESGAQVLFPQLAFLERLESLSIKVGAENNIYQEGALHLALGISKLKTLKLLNITIDSNNYIALRGLGYLSQAISSLVNLSNLSLRIAQGNTWKSKFDHYNKSEMETLESELQRLDGNYVGGIYSLGLALQKLTNLKEIRFAFRLFDISREDVCSLLRGFSCQSNLQILQFESGERNKVYIEKYCRSIESGRLSGMCVNLKYLELEISQKFLKEESIELGETLRNLINLQSLLIRFNEDCQLNEESAFEFFSRLSPLKSIEELSLILQSANKIDIRGTQGIATSLLSFQLLKKLNLHFERNNNINNHSVQQLGDSIKELNVLKKLNLKIGSFNNMGTSGAEYLCDCISKLTTLSDLLINFGNQNNLDNSIIQVLNTKLSNLKQLERLKLSVGAPNVDSFQMRDAFANMRLLKNLKLVIQSVNKIQNDSGIGESLCYLNNLTNLNLIIENHNNLGQVGAFQIAEAITLLNNLESLSISIGMNNNILLEGGVQIGRSLEKLKKLNSIDLKIEQGNDISKETVYAIYSSLKQLQNLKTAKFSIFGSYFIYLLPLVADNPNLNKETFEINGFYYSFSKASTEEESELPQQCLKLMLNSNNGIYDIAHLSSAFEVLSGFPDLTQLDLDLYVKFTISPKEVSILAESLSQLKSLQKLTLNIKEYISFNNECMKELTVGLLNLQELRAFSIKIVENNVLSEGATLLCMALNKLKRLEELSLIINKQFILDDRLTFVLFSEQFYIELQKLIHLTKFTFKIENIQINNGILKQIAICQPMVKLQSLFIVVPKIAEFMSQRQSNKLKMVLALFENLVALEYFQIESSLSEYEIVVEKTFKSIILDKLKKLKVFKFTFTYLSDTDKQRLKQQLFRFKHYLVNISLRSNKLSYYY